jgi:hypothetical protein
VAHVQMLAGASCVGLQRIEQGSNGISPSDFFAALG